MSSAVPVETKTCIKCGDDCPISDFRRMGKYIRGECRGCENARSTRRYRAWRKKVIEFLGGACAECGSTERLEIDHINPAEKAFNPTSRSKLSWEKNLPELLKCQLLCNQCHKAKTYGWAA